MHAEMLQINYNLGIHQYKHLRTSLHQNCTPSKFRKVKIMHMLTKYAWHIYVIMVAMEPRNSVRRGMVLKPYTVPNSSPNSPLFFTYFLMILPSFTSGISCLSVEPSLSIMPPHQSNRSIDSPVIMCIYQHDVLDSQVSCKCILHQTQIYIQKSHSFILVNSI